MLPERLQDVTPHLTSAGVPPAPMLIRRNSSCRDGFGRRLQLDQIRRRTVLAVRVSRAIDELGIDGELAREDIEEPLARFWREQTGTPR